MKIKRQYLLFFICVVFVFTFNTGNGQLQKTIPPSEIAGLIDSVSVLLKDYYVFPEVATKIEKHLAEQLVRWFRCSCTNIYDLLLLLLL